MKDKVINKNDGKRYTFARFYIINNDKLFITSDSNFDENLKKCYCIKKLGSNVHPKIFLDIKKDNKIIKKNQYIGDYKLLMDFIVENQNEFIFIKGFSRAGMAEFLRIMNKLKGTNIIPITFKNKLSEAQYERYLLTKEQRLEELNQKLEEKGEIESSQEYMKISNSVFGKKRYKSRIKIIKIRNK